MSHPLNMDEDVTTVSRMPFRQDAGENSTQ